MLGEGGRPSSLCWGWGEGLSICVGVGDGGEGMGGGLSICVFIGGWRLVECRQAELLGSACEVEFNVAS